MAPSRRLVTSVAATAALAGVATAQGACQNNTVMSSVPSNGTNLALQSWSYCGGALDLVAYIANLDFDKTVTVVYSDASGQVTPYSSVQLMYQGNVSSDNNFQFWGANATNVYQSGITQLINMTYDASDLGKTYTQTLNIPVNASGNPAPTAPPGVKPYAAPSGLGTDITSWLAASNGSEAAISKTGLFNNVYLNVKGAANGTVIAAQSYENPNYAYNWVRDASLTMDVVQQLYAAATTGSATSYYENILFAYAMARAGEQNDPHLQTYLGEPKFNLNNSVFTGPWGRPQNDGPATSAITLMNFATAYLANNGSMDTVKSMIYDSTNNPTTAPVQKDLLYVAANWSAPSFDIWEEEEGVQFYDHLVQHRALSMGAAFATKLGDSATSTTLSSAASACASSLAQFWNPSLSLIVYEYGPVLHGKTSYKDTATMLGIIHGYNGDQYYAPSSDYVLSSAYQISTSFIDVFPLSNTTKNSAGGILGIPVGRYPEDTYNGTSTSSQGNPWYLCTATFAEIFYRAVPEFQSAGSITVSNVTEDFWSYFAPNANVTAGSTYKSSDPMFTTMISALQGWGDAFMRRIQAYTPADGSLTEEFNRASGAPQGAADLTWSYASILTASFARAAMMNDTSYATNLANLGFS